MILKKHIISLIIFISILMCVQYGHAQNSNPDTTTGKGEFSIVPYIDYSSTLGLGYGLVPMYSFKIGKESDSSPKSMLGVVGYRTTNKSFALLTFGMLYLNDDKWRIQYAFGTTDYKFQTYYQPPVGEGSFLDYSTESTFIFTNFRRRIKQNLYLGLGYSYQPFTTNFDDENIEESKTTLSVLQFDLFNDKRDFVYYPKKGHLLLVRFNYMPTWVGNDVTSEVLIVNFNKYFGIADNRDVLAFRFHTKAGLNNIRFQQQPVLGGVDLRGYSKGEFRGDGVLTLQGEYRWNFPNKLRLSAVGFSGLGTLYGSDVKDNNWKLYPSIGAGIRYQAFKKMRTNVGVDIAAGKDDWGIYFRINEAF